MPRIPSLIVRVGASPQTGSGEKLVWRWMLRTARECKLSGYKQEVAYQVIRSGVEDCGRTVSDREINRAITRAYGAPVSGNTGAHGASSWPKPDVSQVERLVAEYPEFNVEVMRGHELNRAGMYAENLYGILEKLFFPKSLLCIGTDTFSPMAISLDRLKRRNPQMFQFIVPSPMTKRSGKNQDGEPSVRCLDTVGPRRFLVIEFDFKKTDDNGNPTIWTPLIERWESQGLSVKDACARLVRHLAKDRFPLAMVVDSGGKSLHAWFYVQGEPETLGSALREFINTAATLGADTQVFVRCQWVRFPGGTRANGKIQSVTYFRPDLIPIPENIL